MGNELQSTFLLIWKDKISFEIPVACNSISLTKNPLYIAACCHESSNIRYRMISGIDSDIVYWHVPSENLELTTDIQMCSGMLFI